MRRIWLMTMMILGAAWAATAQSNRGMLVDRTHIPDPPNATWQNNSQFYNKDNHTLPHRRNVMTTGNGTYWQPGYSNEANRNSFSTGLTPGTSVNSSVNTSGNSYYNSTINVNSIFNGTVNMNKTAPGNINSNVYRR